VNLLSRFVSSRAIGNQAGVKGCSPSAQVGPPSEIPKTIPLISTGERVFDLLGEGRQGGQPWES
jgi:hypothetical protein